MVLMDSQVTEGGGESIVGPATEPLPMDGEAPAVAKVVHRWRVPAGSAPAGAEARGRHIAEAFDEIVAACEVSREGLEWIHRLRPVVMHLGATDDEVLRSHRHPAWTFVNQVVTLHSPAPGRRPPNLADWLAQVTAQLARAPSRERFDQAGRRLHAWRTRHQKLALPVGDPMQRDPRLAQGVAEARERLSILTCSP